VQSSSTAERSGCQSGMVPAESRAIMVTSAVSGKRLSASANVPLGSCVYELMNTTGRINGMTIMVVAWEASRRFGTSAPTPAIRLA